MTTFKKGYGSKWSTYDDDIVEAVKSKPELEGKWTKIAKEVVKEELSEEEFAQLKIYIYRRFKGTTSYNKNKSKATETIIDTSTETNQYANDSEDKTVFMPSAWDVEENKFLSIDEYCSKYNLPKDQVRSSKLVSHLSSHMVYNIAFNPTIHEQTGVDEDFIESVVKKYINPLEKTRPDRKYNSKWFDRLVLTDAHIGMDVNGSKNIEPLYQGKWNREEVLKRLDITTLHVSDYAKGRNIIVDDLGDLLDGLGGQTTRKGHDLPQNMSDKEAFDLAVEFKVTLVEILLKIYDRVTVNNICEDNHSGVFSYFVNKSCKSILEQKHPDRVEYNLIERFMDHYSVGKHTFIITHGKDSESLKFGFKPILDTKQSEKIDQYCKEHKLYNGNYIEFSKGDSHQGMFDDTTSNDFVYYNYPAFSPPSNWVKTNFKNTKSGLVFWNIDMNSQVKIKIPYYFE